MSITKELYRILIKVLQLAGFSSKTYNLFNPVQSNNFILRKGHIIADPTPDQLTSVNHEILRKLKIDRWFIEDHTKEFELLSDSLSDLQWPKRNPDIIDSIIIGATDSPSVGAKQLFDNDTSTKNDITPGKPLPGISYHLFINSTGIIEKVSDYSNVTLHTPGYNETSIGVALQYSINDNNSPPVKKMFDALEKVLIILCLEHKLNPYKAIRGQRELRYFGFGKGHKTLLNKSPGLLIDLNALRRRVAIQIQKKLKYYGSYNGDINGKFSKETKVALNKFKSDAIKLMYTGFYSNKHYII